MALLKNHGAYNGTHHSILQERGCFKGWEAEGCCFLRGLGRTHTLSPGQHPHPERWAAPTPGEAWAACAARETWASGQFPSKPEAGLGCTRPVTLQIESTQRPQALVHVCERCAKHDRAPMIVGNSHSPGASCQGHSIIAILPRVFSSLFSSHEQHWLFPSVVITPDGKSSLTQLDYGVRNVAGVYFKVSFFLRVPTDSNTK